MTGGPRATLILGKKENHRRKKSRQGKQRKLGSQLAQGLDLPLDKVEKSKLVAKTIGKSKVYIGSSVQ